MKKYSCFRRDRSLLSAVLFIVLVISFQAIAYGADATRRVQLGLDSGNDVVVEKPDGRLKLHCGGFVLESPLHLIVKITHSRTSGYVVTFTNGESLSVTRLSGNIQYEGDFGPVKLDSSSLRSLTTVANPSKETAVGNFNRSHYKFKTILTFFGGATRTVYLSEYGLSVRHKWKDMTIDLWPSRTRLVFDWKDKQTLAFLPDGSVKEFPNDSSRTRELEAWTDLGQITFAPENLLECKPQVNSQEAFAAEFVLALADNETIPISKLSHTCSDYSSHKRQCLKLDGRVVEEVFWDNVTEIAVAKTEHTAQLRFTDGTEGTLQADTFRAECPLGRMTIPFSPAVLSKLVRSKASVAGRDTLPQRLRLINGDEFTCTVHSVSGFSRSTSPGVLHFTEFPTLVGTWLSELDSLNLTASSQELTVHVLGNQLAVADATPANPDRRIEIATSRARFSVSLSDVASVETRQPVAPVRTVKTITLVTRDSERHKFSCERLQFVRYPDRIFSGTMYNRELGAWFWRHEDHVDVKSGESELKVRFDKIRSLKASGRYPSWDIEVVSANSASVLKGQIVPAKVAKQGPGVSSWDANKEGFSLWGGRGHAFLFVPMKCVSEIHIEER